MIKLTHVNKKIEKEQILSDLTLTVNKGSIYGLLGSNGAGKTTMLKTLAGILKQDSGTVTIEGENVYENNGIKQSVFFMPDYPTFFPQYTTKQMANFFQSIYPNWSEERFLKLGEVFELDVNKKIHTYSKGLQRQAAFWLALSTNPSVFILDEPFDGLDPVIRTKVKNLLVQEVAEREMTVIISSHNLREVEDLCDHIGIIHKGTCIIEKDIDDLKSDIHKIQVAFPKETKEKWKESIKPLYMEQRGSVYMLIVRGEKQKLLTDIEAFKPVLLDMLPLTLEEIFIYEMGDMNYAIQNILLS
ncbi:ABC transporter ATP-binding protein [Niallia sp. NCCP-28]|uniref:ABC transporter ATP-binding protein n=1 Tax=Niallia sp. NCCP-28 TaxID=2934712 RepID=UPI00207FDB5D|nr:ABC transporter ATP-binding protein [Niallia sp. NCCP-28]GKU84777.1 ABC transporter ATP-binding protein [Niallia sp. NCCP-28]